MVVGLNAKADPVADFYKGRTITALVGVSPGGEYDFQLRLVARHLGKKDRSHHRRCGLIRHHAVLSDDAE